MTDTIVAVLVGFVVGAATILWGWSIRRRSI